MYSDERINVFILFEVISITIQCHDIYTEQKMTLCYNIIINVLLK